MLCRVVGRSNAGLKCVLHAIVSAEGVVRSSTVISLATQVPYRILPVSPGLAPRRREQAVSPLAEHQVDNYRPIVRFSGS